MIILASRFASDFGPRHGRRGGFGHPGLVLLGLLLLAGVVVAAVVLWRGSRDQPSSTTTQVAGAPAPAPATAAEAILSERFARGEVTVEDFVTARSALRGEWMPPRQTVSADARPANSSGTNSPSG